MVTVENQLTYGALAACTDRRDPLVINGVRYVADPDPKPPTLREQVADIFRVGAGPEYGTNESVADAVLVVVADWLAAQPIHDGTAAGLFGLEPRAIQRDHDITDEANVYVGPNGQKRCRVCAKALNASRTAARRAARAA